MGELTTTPRVWPRIVWYMRWLHLLIIWIAKGLQLCQWHLSRARATLNYATGSPIIYAQRPALKHRLFYPSSGGSATLPPLYIDIHGGGFAFGRPADDDHFSAFMSRQFHFLVLSIQYSLSPLATFPQPVEDVVAVVEAILNDDSLGFDRARVAIGGFSAGGNLALAASQAPSLQGKIRAAVPWCSPVDWTVDYQTKLDSRVPRYTGDSDHLAGWAPILNDAYLPTGTDLRDPRLSIIYAKRSELPEYIFAIGAEHDMLRDEAWRMMIKLVEESEGIKETRGKAFERSDGRLRWQMVEGVEHSFAHWHWKTGKEAVAAKEEAEKRFTEVGKWLMEKAFASGEKTAENRVQSTIPECTLYRTSRN